MRIRIENFQSLGRADIEAEGLTVLVGRSNLGKSATVRALEGALFNRPGEDFVREGQSTCRVEVGNLPTAGGVPLNVVWEKGHNTNRFRVDGEDFSKVGVTAPPPLIAAGYRDLKIGGESLRPQVAGQFDRIFLLDRPGSFVSDVLSVISRLAVLLNADRACTKDLKAEKQLLTVRQGDLTTAEKKLAAMQPIVELHDRVKALAAHVARAREVETMLADVRRLVALRAQLLPATRLTLPDATQVPADIGRAYLTAKPLTRDRRRLQPAAALGLPEHTALPADLGAVYLTAKPLTAERRRVVPAATKRLPRVVVQRPDTIDRAQARMTQVREYVRARARAASVARLVLPPQTTDYPGTITKLEEWQDRASEVRVLKARYLTLADVVVGEMRSAKAMTHEVEMAEAALAQARAESKVCPVCDRPWEEVHV